MQVDTSILARQLSDQEIHAVTARERAGAYGPPPRGGWLWGNGPVDQTRWIPLAAFADANGLGFARRSPTPLYPGLIFDLGWTRWVDNHVFSLGGAFADAGQLGYEVTRETGGYMPRPMAWNFAVFRLPRPMPHMVLDSKVGATRFGWSLPVSFSRKQKVPIEGRAERHFQLYAAQGHGGEAQTVFSPGLLDTLVDRQLMMILEIVDQWLFCYSQRSLHIIQPATWQDLSAVEDLVVGQLGRIAHACPPHPVPPHARRMRRTLF